VALRKLRDRKPDVSDLRDIHTHVGVLIFEIRIDRSGSVADVRLAKPVDQQPPWPTLAQRWLEAISDWRYEPPTLHHKPVAVCLTVTVRVEVR
jgi:outer membrane biosynthesis protein TonB